MDHRHDPAPNDQRATDSLEVVDEERRKKIARLKQAVADGTYHVSAGDLADKLIAHMLEPKA